MKKFILLFLFLVFLPSTAQNNSDQTEDKIYASVEVNPEPLGGINAFREYVTNELLKSIGHIKSNLQASLLIRFVVNENGKLINFEVLKDNSKSYNLSELVIKIMKKYPDWKPGYMYGKAVKVYYNFPLKFNITS